MRPMSFCAWSTPIGPTPFCSPISPSLAKERQQGLPCSGQYSNTTSVKVLPGMLLQPQLSGASKLWKAWLILSLLSTTGHTKPARALLYHYLIIMVTLWAPGLKPQPHKRWANTMPKHCPILSNSSTIHHCHSSVLVLRQACFYCRMISNSLRALNP